MTSPDVTGLLEQAQWALIAHDPPGANEGPPEYHFEDMSSEGGLQWQSG